MAKASLHEHVRGMIWGQTEGVRRLHLSDLTVALAEGEEANALDENGLTPLGVMFHEMEGLNEEMNRGVWSLIDHGADPLKHDQVFQKSCANAVTQTKYLSFIISMMHELWVREKQGQAVLLTENGSPALHVVLETCPVITASNIIRSLKDAPGHLKGRSQDILTYDWVSQVDAGGNTPLHILWGEQGLLAQAHEKTLARQGNFKSAASCAWSITETLLERGADLLAKNHQGLTVFQACQDLCDRGVPMLAEQGAACREAFARAQNQALEQNTRPSGPTNKPGPRL